MIRRALKRADNAVLTAQYEKRQDTFCINFLDLEMAKMDKDHIVLPHYMSSVFPDLPPHIFRIIRGDSRKLVEIFTGLNTQLNAKFVQCSPPWGIGKLPEGDEESDAWKEADCDRCVCIVILINGIQLRDAVRGTQQIR